MLNPNSFSSESTNPTVFPLATSMAGLWKQTAVIFFITCYRLSVTLVNSDWTEQSEGSSVQGQAPWNSMKLCIAANRGFNLCAKGHKTGSSGLSTITLLPQRVPRLFVTFADWKKKPPFG